MTGTRFTFKANRDRGRHGWLRLTPAYSVNLAEELTAGLNDGDLVLDPFCGTGTTALVCAERGIPCVTNDINPFLVWFAAAKIYPYSPAEVAAVLKFSERVQLEASEVRGWIPPMQFIERWWTSETLTALSSLWNQIEQAETSVPVRDLLKIAFCQTLMKQSQANFRHQSVSLKSDISPKLLSSTNVQTTVVSAFTSALALIAFQAETITIKSYPEVLLMDSRCAPQFSKTETGLARQYTAVITSPPYANRMSYIRELRPYMYWLGFLESGKQAGDFDWQAIGGTWGAATSNLSRWVAGESPVSDERILTAIDTIALRSLVLGNYIRKYIQDTSEHLHALRASLAPGAKVTYIVGNSRFYDSLLETERIYGLLFESIGLVQVEIRTLRKRTSKRELFEFAVTGRAPDSIAD